MSVKELIKSLPGMVKDLFIKVGTKIANAKVETIVKLSVSLGLSVAVVLFILKFLKDKKASYTDENEKTLVDEALEINYNDIRKQKKLHPLMNKVVDELESELKPRTKSMTKKARAAKEELSKIQKDVNKRKLKREYNEFLNNMEYEDKMLAAGYEYEESPDFDALVNIWNS